MGLIRKYQKKVLDGTRFTLSEGMDLFRSGDLFELGKLAGLARNNRHGKRVTYVVNKQINPTNICVSSCRFCDFSRHRKHPEAYALNGDDALEGLSSDIREVHITGGLHPRWRLEDYLGIIRTIKRRFPEIQIKAYTAVEIDYFSKQERRPVEEILKELLEAGVQSLPGGGAEIFSERVRSLLFPAKISGGQWLEIHETAHRLGLKSNATLLFGHIETPEERLYHLDRLRRLQDKTNGFLSFVPLTYQPGSKRIVEKRTPIFDELKMMAISRLMLDNISHIKSYWVTLGEETAALALHFGADDLDGTIGGEQIMHATGTLSPSQMAQKKLEKLIHGAGLIPVERDGLFNRVQRKGTMMMETAGV